MPPTSKQARFEHLVQMIMTEVRRTWLNTVLPTEVLVLSRQFNKRFTRLGMNLTDVLLGLESGGVLKFIRTPKGKAWVMLKSSWDAIAPVIRDTAPFRLDRLVELRKALNTEAHLPTDTIHRIEAELVSYSRFD